MSQEYEVDEELSSFFAKTTTSQLECEAKARQLTRSDRAEAIPIQGVCSCTVQARDKLQHVVQCRLNSLALNLSICRLASRVHGCLVPSVEDHGILGDDNVDSKEPLRV